MKNSKFMLMAGVCLGVAFLSGLAQAQPQPLGSIYLEVSPCDRCVRPGEMIDVAVKVQNLEERIHTVRATLNYVGSACPSGGSVGTVCAEVVEPGEPFWTDVMETTANTSTTFVMGLQPLEFKAVGTVADNTVARFRLKACEEGQITLSITGATANTAPNCVYPGDPQPATRDLTAGPEITVCIDKTPPTVAITQIAHQDCPTVNLLLEAAPCPSPTDNCSLPGSCETTLCAGPGTVTITLNAGDNCNFQPLRPIVQVITACGTLTDITSRHSPFENSWTFTYDITNATEPGLAVVRAQVTDCAGNVSLEALGTFQICPVLTISGLVELQGFSGSLREVYFNVNDNQGNTVPTFIQVLQFSRMKDFFNNPVGLYVLRVPVLTASNITSVQAKTAWNLSQTQVIGAANQCCGHLLVNFTSPDNSMLLAGDLATAAGCGRFKLGDDIVDDVIGGADLAFVDNAIGEAARVGYYNYWADVNGDGTVTTADRGLVDDNVGARVVPPFAPR